MANLSQCRYCYRDFDSEEKANTQMEHLQTRLGVRLSDVRSVQTWRDMTKVEKGFTSTATSSLTWLGQLYSQLLTIVLRAIGLLDGSVGRALLLEGDEGVTLSSVGDIGDRPKLFELFLEGRKRL